MTEYGTDYDATVAILSAEVAGLFVCRLRNYCPSSSISQTELDLIFPMFCCFFSLFHPGWWHWKLVYHQIRNVPYGYVHTPKGKIVRLFLSQKWKLKILRNRQLVLINASNLENLSDVHMGSLTASSAIKIYRSRSLNYALECKSSLGQKKEQIITDNKVWHKKV